MAAAPTFRLELECGACGESYVAMLGEAEVGYMIVRHGLFRVHCPADASEPIHSANPEGDGLFAAHERARWLREGVRVVLARLAEEGRAPEVDVDAVVDAAVARHRVWLDAAAEPEESDSPWAANQIE
jgi:hypothetical protein